MARKDKGRRYRAEAGFGAVVTRQPAPGKTTYGYELVCGKCGWHSDEREGAIDSRAVQQTPGGMTGRFDCGSCRVANTFAIRETRE
jgi:hypothetical protein